MSNSCYECLHADGSVCTLSGGCVFEPIYTAEHKDIIGNLLKKPSKQIEKEHLDKLVNDHWNYIEGVLWAASNAGPLIQDEDIVIGRFAEIEFHYRTAAKHFWGHAREYHVGGTL